MEKIKNVLKYILIFIITVISLLGIFYITVKFIPKEKIENNIKESANYLKNNTEIKEVKPNRYYSYLHVYADEILLNMIYCMDITNPLASIMEAKFYGLSTYTEGRDLVDEGPRPSLEVAIENNGIGNQEYIRYWHGSMIIIRPLLILFNIQQIYYIMAGVLIILTLILLIILIRKKQILLIISTIIGYIMICINYVPFCLEYVWTFLIMLSITIAGISTKKRNIIFFLSGILTCFFDFLSTEIITLFVPIIYIYTIRYKNNEVQNIKEEIKQIIMWIILWGIGYISMWGTKWIMASIVLNINSMEYVFDRAMLRVNGPVLNYSKSYVIINGLIKNIKTIYPFYLFKSEITIIAIILGSIITIALIIKKDRKSIINLLIYIAIACTPYIRYIVLSNHSYRHFFFTFREQLITILAIIIGIVISIDKERLNKKIIVSKKKK